MTQRKKLSPIQKAYAVFFAKKLNQYGVDTPSELSDEQKIKFFNSIKDEWDKEKEKLIENKVIPESKNLTTKEKGIIAEYVILRNIGKTLVKDLGEFVVNNKG